MDHWLGLAALSKFWLLLAVPGRRGGAAKIRSFTRSLPHNVLRHLKLYNKPQRVGAMIYFKDIYGKEIT
jgi:hypothetical protein